MPLDKYRYIVIEGPIGVGKTSLTQRLVERTGARMLLEKPQDNPFLERFYQDAARYALPTQLFFLFQRINEVREVAQMDLFSQRTISDYLFEKDSLFARLTLSEDEYKLYQSIYQTLSLQAPTPDLVIYLQASTPALVERVQRRGLRYERTINEDYLSRLAKSYGEFFHHYDAAPLLVVNSDHLNFVDSDEDFELLLGRIENMRGSREFFSLGA